VAGSPYKEKRLTWFSVLEFWSHGAAVSSVLIKTSLGQHHQGRSAWQQERSHGETRNKRDRAKVVLLRTTSRVPPRWTPRAHLFKVVPPFNTTILGAKFQSLSSCKSANRDELTQYTQPQTQATTSALISGLDGAIFFPAPNTHKNKSQSVRK
jgi:hypothetical protein